MIQYTKQMRGTVLASIIGSAVASSAAIAGSTTAEVVAPEAAVEETSVFDKIWDVPTLYSNKENKVLQKFRIVGRFQADYAAVDASQGSYDDFSVRRFRLGFKSQWFKDFTWHMEMDIEDENLDAGNISDAYNGLTDAYIAWAPSKQFKLKVGKQSAGFTLDGKTSSKKLLTLERNNLSNNLWFTKEYFSGISVGGTKDNLLYKGGVFSSELNKELAEFDAGYFALASVGYDLSGNMGVDESLLALEYVYNEPDVNNGTRAFEHVVSLNHQFQKGDWGLRTDLSGGAGYLGQSNVWGVVVMPFYDINDKLQVAARYSYVGSEDDNGVRLNRYESKAVDGRGDSYNEGYLGLNWYLYGQKLKFQTGVTYASMGDSANDGGAYDGWGWSVGLRMYW